MVGTEVSGEEGTFKVIYFNPVGRGSNGGWV
jgi:hypothetical protein